MRMWIAVVMAVLSFITNHAAVTEQAATPQINYLPNSDEEWQRHYDNAADMFDLYYQAADPVKVTAIMEFNRLYDRVGVIEDYRTGELITFPTYPLKMKRVNGRFVSHNLLITRGV